MPLGKILICVNTDYHKLHGSSIVLVLWTFDEESLGTKIHRNEAAADRQESIRGNLVRVV